MVYYFILNNKVYTSSVSKQVILNEQAQAGGLGVILDEVAYREWAAIYDKPPVPIKPVVEEPQQ